MASDAQYHGGSAAAETRCRRVRVQIGRRQGAGTRAAAGSRRLTATHCDARPKADIMKLAKHRMTARDLKKVLESIHIL